MEYVAELKITSQKFAVDNMEPFRKAGITPEVSRLVFKYINYMVTQRDKLRIPQHLLKGC